MNKYLQLLLQQESTVIIPGFGAIVIANEQTGDLLFNEYLKFNDGKLVEFIVDQSNMDEQEALNFIAKYVREINTQLDKGESYDMFGFGSFTKNKDGKIVFVSWDKIKDKGPAEVQNIVEEEEQIQEEVEKKEAKKEEQAVKVVESKKEETEKTKEKKENSYIAPTSKNLEKEKVTEEAKKKETPQKENRKTPQNEAKEVKVRVATQKKVVAVPPKKKNRWGLIIILLLILGIGTILSIKFEEIKNYLSNSENTTEEKSMSSKDNTKELKEEVQENEPVDTALEDSLDQIEKDSLDLSLAESEEIESNEVEEIEEEVSVEKTTASRSTSGKYKMITGNFAEIENAERMVEDLKKLGYDAEIIGVYYGLHRVAMSRYDDYQEAIKHIPEAKEIVSGAYVSPQ